MSSEISFLHKIFNEVKMSNFWGLFSNSTHDETVDKYFYIAEDKIINFSDPNPNTLFYSSHSFKCVELLKLIGFFYVNVAIYANFKCKYRSLYCRVAHQNYLFKKTFPIPIIAYSLYYFYFYKTADFHKTFEKEIELCEQYKDVKFVKGEKRKIINNAKKIYFKEDAKITEALKKKNSLQKKIAQKNLSTAKQGIGSTKKLSTNNMKIFSVNEDVELEKIILFMEKRGFFDK